MHQYQTETSGTTLTWTLKKAPAVPHERYCPGCGRKVAFIDSGVRRHNANGKKIYKWAIYKCPQGHTWNKTLEKYTADHAAKRSEPASREQNGYGRQENKGETTLEPVPDLSREAVEIVLRGEGKGVRLDKLLSEKGTGLSRTEIQRRIEGGCIRLNGKAVQSKKKVKAGDRITILQSQDMKQVINE